MINRNILIVGGAGCGKSALCNVLTDTQNFGESEYTVNEPCIQKGYFNFKGTRYCVVDTVRIGDINLAMMSKIAAEINLVSEGISRVLLVTDGRFTVEEKKIYNFLKDTILKNDLVTIVRTKFPDFRSKEECDVDKRMMSEKNDIIAEIIRCGDVIHVDNPPINIIVDDDTAASADTNDINIRTRNRSREILLCHMEKVCENDNMFNKIIARIMMMIKKI